MQDKSATNFGTPVRRARLRVRANESETDGEKSKYIYMKIKKWRKTFACKYEEIQCNYHKPLVSRDKTHGFVFSDNVPMDVVKTRPRTDIGLVINRY